METIVHELRSIIETFSARLERLSAEELSARPRPGKWSRKEVIGHLIDSAHNNLRRFIVGQYDPSAHVIYEQDFWVKANDYQSMEPRDLIVLWNLLNQRICTVLLTMPAENLRKQLNTGKDRTELHSLEWLATDYVKHMKHHLNQVFDNAFQIVYP